MLTFLKSTASITLVKMDNVFQPYVHVSPNETPIRYSYRLGELIAANFHDFPEFNFERFNYFPPNRVQHGKARATS